MRFKKYLLKQPLFLLGLLFLFSCSNEENVKNTAGAVAEQPAQKPKGQFPFYKNISIRPGLDFEVVSWGKGLDSIGGYLVLMSDSTKSNYKSMSNEREGIITDAWNMDMDNDGNPEVYIELMSEKDKLDLHVYEYSGGSFRKITFPGLSNNMKKIYGGKDKFFIKEGDLYRSFPVVAAEGSDEPAGTTKTIQYRLSGNSFSASEVTE